ALSWTEATPRRPGRPHQTGQSISWALLPMRYSTPKDLEMAHDISRRDLLGVVPVSFVTPLLAQQRATPRPFNVSIPRPTIDRILNRVKETRLPDRLDAPDWRYGANWAFMRALTEYWTTTFDSTSIMSKGAVRNRCRSCSPTVGPGPCSNSSKRSVPCPIPRASAARLTMRSTSSCRPSRALAFLRNRRSPSVRPPSPAS